MRRIADIAREILGIAPGTRDRRVSAILVSILKSEENLSYWGLIKHFDRHPGDLELCEMSRPYCRSWYQLRVSETDPAVLQKVIAKMAGCDAVHDTLLVDSSGFSIARYVDWQNAKYGRLSVRLFAKLHIMHTLHGMVCAATVTAGNASDSPYLRLMVETLPEGDGDVLADAAYGGIKNCNAIRDSGRRAIIDSKCNWGTNPLRRVGHQASTTTRYSAHRLFFGQSGPSHTRCSTSHAPHRMLSFYCHV